jgi:hypothetical protein
VKRLAHSTLSSLCLMATAYFMLADSNPDPAACGNANLDETVQYSVDGCGFLDDWTIAHTELACAQTVTVVPKRGAVPDLFGSYSGGLFSEGWTSATKSYDRTCTATKESATVLHVHCDGPGRAACDMTMTRHDATLVDAGDAAAQADQ